jgi:hypothetical protein
MFHHHIYFKYVIIIFTFSQIFWIRRMVTKPENAYTKKMEGAKIRFVASEKKKSIFSSLIGPPTWLGGRRRFLRPYEEEPHHHPAGWRGPRRQGGAVGPAGPGHGQGEGLAQWVFDNVLHGNHPGFAIPPSASDPVARQPAAPL